MARPRTNRRDRWYLPKSNPYHFLGYCYERNSRVYLYLPNHIRKSTKLSFVPATKQIALNLLEQEIMAGRRTKIMTCGDLYEEIKKIYYPKMKKHSIKIYDRVYRNYIVANCDLQDMPAIRKHILNIYSEKLQPVTIRIYLTALRFIFQHAVNEGYIERNPVALNMIPRVNRKERQELSDDDIIRILDKIKEIDEQVHSITFIIYHTGMRINEALSIKAEDIKQDHLLVRGKGDRNRVIPLESFPELAEHLKRYKGSGNIFTVQLHRCLYVLKCAMDDLNIKVSGKFHAIRRYRENRMIDDGINVKIAAQILGHTLATQSKHYITEKKVDELADGMSKKRVKFIAEKSESSNDNEK